MLWFLLGCPAPEKPEVGESGGRDSGYTIPFGTCDEDGFTESEGDCDDCDSAINPAADEICDGRDNDCDGEIDEDGATWYYLDEDGDGFGDRRRAMLSCEPDWGYVAVAGDCDDTDEAVYPDAPEACDGLDNDCDAVVDEHVSLTWYADRDGDGFGDPKSALSSCDAPKGYVAAAEDCDDAVSAVNPGATESCDGIDDDCDGTTDEDC